MEKGRVAILIRKSAPAIRLTASINAIARTKNLFIELFFN